ncbi:MAG TPA: AgmX/PglI C-terminal domain-containing protein [Polyangiaceae bacterium]|nr:AgmX/PglI C-terminal domain-containing protein [Polyangiaceae bacterium]
MKTTLLIAASLTSLTFIAGCSGAVRSPDMYRDDTKAALATKDGDIRSCYDQVLASTPTAAGKVTVKFDVDTDAGKIGNVTVDKANTTAPDLVSDCVTRNITGVAITPPDAKKGEGTWVYEFNPPAKG